MSKNIIFPFAAILYTGPFVLFLFHQIIFFLMVLFDFRREVTKKE